MPHLKPCNHCLSEKISLSRRSRGGWYNVAYYCRQCHAYGPRVVVSDGANAVDYRNAEEQAAELWNTRLEQTTCLED